MLVYKKITYFLLFTMLFFPILSYLYLKAGLPKTVLHLYSFIFLIYGLFFFITNKNSETPKFLYFLIGYMIYIPIRVHLAEGFRDINFLTQIYYDTKNISIFFIILIIYNTNFSDRFIKKSLFIIKITVIVAVIVSIIQIFNQGFYNGLSYYKIEDVFSLSKYQFRRSSIFGFIDPNALGLSFIPLLSVLIGYMLYNKEKRYIFFLLIGGLIAFISNTRYVMIGFVIITIQIMIINKVKISGIFKYILIISLGVIILFQTLSYFGYNMQEWINERLFAEGDISETTRYKAIGNFIIFFPKTPVFGTGVHLTREIREASHAVGSSQIHVGYLSHMVSYGIVGSFLLFGFWISLAKKIYKTAKQTNYWGSFFAFLTYFWAQATLVNYSIFFYGLIFALIFDKYFQDKYQNSLNVLKHQ